MSPRSCRLTHGRGFLITKKSDQTNIGVINLAKVAAVHIHPIEGLEIFSDVSGTPAKFSDDLYDFHIVEIAMDGKASLAPATISEILTAYMSEE